MKNVENMFKNFIVSTNFPDLERLAIKYGVPLKNGVFDAGCPGIMSPLQETPPIELSWLSGFNNPDKKMRGEQFHKALLLVDKMVTGNDFSLHDYLELNIHGRAMFFHILSTEATQKQVKTDVILEIITPIAGDGLTMHEIPFGKGGVTVGTIFTKYISPNLTKSSLFQHEPGSFPAEEKLAFGSPYEQKAAMKEEKKEWKEGLDDLFTKLYFLKDVKAVLTHREVIIEMRERTTNLVEINSAWDVYCIKNHISDDVHDEILGNIITDFDSIH